MKIDPSWIWKCPNCGMTGPGKILPRYAEAMSHTICGLKSTPIEEWFKDYLTTKEVIRW